MTRFAIRLLLGAFVAALAAPAGAADGMKMPMPMSDTPAHFKVARAVYTTDHRYLVKLVSLPVADPLREVFRVRLEVYEGRTPHRNLADAQHRDRRRHAPRLEARLRAWHGFRAEAREPRTARSRSRECIST